LIKIQKSAEAGVLNGELSPACKDLLANSCCARSLGRFAVKTIPAGQGLCALFRKLHAKRPVFAGYNSTVRTTTLIYYL
jgi:hypothetical protein